MVRSDKDVDALIARLGGRVTKLRGNARKRFRKELRKEIDKVEQSPKVQLMALESIAGAVTAALTLVAQRFASRLVADEELPPEPPALPDRTS